MNTKEYLQQVYWLNKLIESDIREQEELKRRRISLETPSLESASSVGGKIFDAKYTYVVDKIIDLEKKINEEIDRYIDLKEEIRMAIDKVVDRDEQVILKSRYLNFMKWTDIANFMNYSPQHVFRLHKDALKKIKR